MADNENEQAVKRTQPQHTRREEWAYRVALASFVVFIVFGVYVLFEPTEFRTGVFGVLFGLTLASGVVSGLVAIYSQ